jgi:hypothetical protein
VERAKVPKPGSGRLTSKAFQFLVQVFDIVGVDVTDISHQIGNLQDLVSARSPLKEVLGKSIAYVASAIGHLFIHVVISEDFVHWIDMLDCDCSRVKGERTSP